MTRRTRKIKRLEEAARGSVTVTYWYGERPHTLVAPTRNVADAEALARWGEWTDVVYSTPLTIYRDLVGDTAKRTSHVGLGATTKLLNPAAERLAKRLLRR